MKHQVSGPNLAVVTWQNTCYSNGHYAYDSAPENQHEVQICCNRKFKKTCINSKHSHPETHAQPKTIHCYSYNNYSLAHAHIYCCQLFSIEEGGSGLSRNGCGQFFHTHSATLCMPHHLPSCWYSPLSRCAQPLTCSPSFHTQFPLHHSQTASCSVYLNVGTAATT